MLAERGIDPKRFVLIPVSTVQEFRNQATKICDNVDKVPLEARHPILLVLDSLGNLSTEKEVKDIIEGNDTRDMTRAQLIRGAFRVLALRLSKLQMPMIVTNHTYDVIGAYVPTKEMGGGSGLKYAASTIVYLSKSKDRDSDKNVVGNIIGSGTALTNLNYNAITNKPDLTVYATNTNLNTISTFSALNISNLTIMSNNKQDTYTPERQYPPKLYNSVFVAGFCKE